ncbi:hypothetical protein IB257_25080 [Achromobacter sp. ACM03]|uniref:hypothetical protein n=1 Tax=Achromobacter sp. ACM03 TaxID=2769300 RepID=UPI00177D2EC0|nr:hypothetical protein [Achromobacter sp. ACM03]MBD9433225.1 hypothetical protein [Achromobacter sp. ACM03]
MSVSPLPFSALPVILRAPELRPGQLRASVLQAQITDLADAAHLGWNAAVLAIEQDLAGNRLYSERAVVDVHEAAQRSSASQVAQLIDDLSTAIAELQGAIQAKDLAAASTAHASLAAALATYRLGTPRSAA